MHQFFADLRLPKATEDQKLQLNAPITREEALLALKSMPSSKAPGPDGFGCEFYKEFSDILLDPLLSMLNHSFENGILPPSLREANISLILKKGKCPESCASYRPIALLNSDQKLLSKILASRLEKVLPHIVKEDQTGFIKGRNSCNNLRRLLNIIQLTQSRQEPALVLSLDAEKASGCICFLLWKNLASAKILWIGLGFCIILRRQRFWLMGWDPGRPPKPLVIRYCYWAAGPSSKAKQFNFGYLRWWKGTQNHFIRWWHFNISVETWGWLRPLGRSSSFLAREGGSYKNIHCRWFLYYCQTRLLRCLKAG